MSAMLPPACAECDLHLVELAYGEQAEVPEAARAHLDSCERCREALRELEDTRAIMGALPLEEPSAELDARVLAELDAHFAALAPSPGDDADAGANEAADSVEDADEEAAPEAMPHAAPHAAPRARLALVESARVASPAAPGSGRESATPPARRRSQRRWWVAPLSAAAGLAIVATGSLYVAEKGDNHAVTVAAPAAPKRQNLKNFGDSGAAPETSRERGRDLAVAPREDEWPEPEREPAPVAAAVPVAPAAVPIAAAEPTAPAPDEKKAAPKAEGKAKADAAQPYAFDVRRMDEERDRGVSRELAKAALEKAVPKDTSNDASKDAPAQDEDLEVDAKKKERAAAPAKVMKGAAAFDDLREEPAAPPPPPAPARPQESAKLEEQDAFAEFEGSGGEKGSSFRPRTNSFVGGGGNVGSLEGLSARGGSVGGGSISTDKAGAPAGPVTTVQRSATTSRAPAAPPAPAPMPVARAPEAESKAVAKAAPKAEAFADDALPEWEALLGRARDASARGNHVLAATWYAKAASVPGAPPAVVESALAARVDALLAAGEYARAEAAANELSARFASRRDVHERVRRARVLDEARETAPAKASTPASAD